MKKIFTFLALTSIGLSYAQLPVSQTPEKKKVVLEEHTGKDCYYCPSGHNIANSIYEADPENVLLINIHAGGYASGTPNYRTSYGSDIASQTNLSGYPSGTVNRHYFGYSQSGATTGATAIGRGDWSRSADTIKLQDAYLNVALDAEIDLTTNELTVDVEVYYTDDSPESTNYLNVALLQDDIWGSQSGASVWYPEKVNPETGLYQHNHMLRDLLTGQWGEAITTTTTGSLVQKSYTYALPDSIGDVAIDISKLHLVAFVTETTQEIINGGKGEPVLVNLPSTLDAQLTSLTVDEVSCDGIVEPIINVRNYGDEYITDLTIEYSVNETDTFVYNWSGGPILSGYNLDIPMNQVGFLVEDSNYLFVEIVEVNNSVDEVLTDNSMGASIRNVDEFQTPQITVELTPDDWGSEVFWKLYNSEGEVVDSLKVGTIADGDLTEVSKTTILYDLNCYKFVLGDTYGDGGSTVVIKDEDDNVIHSIASSDYSFSSEFEFTIVDEYGNGFGNSDGSSVNVGTGIVSLDNSFDFEIYPNPTNGKLTINYNEDLSSIQVMNVLGETLIETTATNLDLSSLSSGVYFVKLVNTNGDSSVKSFVKK